MQGEFSESLHCEKNFCTAVSVIYHLNADNSYNVKHPPLPKDINILIYVSGGTGVLKLPKTEVELKKGDVYLFKCNQDFSYYTAEKSWEFWWFEFTADIIPLFYNKVNSIKSDSFLDILCEKSLSMHLRNEFSGASSMLTAFIAYVGQIANRNDTEQHLQQSFYNAQSFIRRNLNDISVNKVAEHINVSTRTLNSLFNKQIKISPKKYILKLKLEKSVYLLRNTNKTIEEISISLGFSSPFHFSKYFKNEMNLTPTAYRKNLRLQSL